MSPMQASAPILRMIGISKAFGATAALSDVSFDLKPGEVHCLVGENGAGKSTLIKILAGLYRPDGGKIEFQGKEYQAQSPSFALGSGIGVVYQELELVPDLAVCENVFLTREPRRWPGVIDWRELSRKARAILQDLGADVDPLALVGTLSVAQQQMVAIAKILSLSPKVLVLDEPSAVLGPQELVSLVRQVRVAKQGGAGIVYISHRLEEVFQLGDRVTVLRDGRLVNTLPVADVTEARLVEMMVGRKVENRFPPRGVVAGSGNVLDVNGLENHRVHDVTLAVGAGEIVGVGGLVGSGRTEILRAIAGVDRVWKGEVHISGKRLSPLTARAAIAHGLALVPEDRKNQGLVLIHSVADNLMLESLPRASRGGVLRSHALLSLVRAQATGLGVKAASYGTKVQSLSGGNQQKVSVGKALATSPNVILLDEPTRGVDVGAKAEFYDIIVRIAAAGHGVLMVSSELPELMALCHRILVVRHGRIVAEFRPPYTAEKVLRAALGSSEDPDKPSATEAVSGSSGGVAQ